MSASIPISFSVVIYKTNEAAIFIKTIRSPLRPPLFPQLFHVKDKSVEMIKRQTSLPAKTDFSRKIFFVHWDGKIKAKLAPSSFPVDEVF